MKRGVVTALMLTAAMGVFYNGYLNAGDDGELKFEHSEYCVKDTAKGTIKAPTGYKSGNSVNNELISEFKFDSVSDGATGVISARFSKNAREKDEQAQVIVQFYPLRDIPGEKEQSLSATCVPVKKTLIFEKDFISVRSEIPGILNEEDYLAEIRIKTEPSGYEDKVVLSIKEIQPNNHDQGLLKAITDKRWEYFAPIESKNDKWPGYDDMSKRYWDLSFLCQIHNCGCTIEKKQFVYSVFKYLYKKERHNRAIAYVALKYPCLHGMHIGSYSPNAYGAYGYTTIFIGRVGYGDHAFDSENIMASTIAHENEHVKQPASLRFIAGLDRLNYMSRVKLKLYPEPWDTPSEEPMYGFYWGAMEYPAYQKEIDLQYQTGAFHDSNGGYIDEQKKARNFFDWLMRNARNRR